MVGALLLYCQIPEPKPKPPVREVLRTAIKSLDLAGFFLVSPAAVMLLLGLQYGGNKYAWNSSTVLGLIIGAAVAFILFLLWEYRKGDEAMVPFAMLKHRIIWSATGTMFFLLATVLVGDFYLAIYFQTVHDNSPVMSGVHMLPATISMVMFTMIAGVLGTFWKFLLCQTIKFTQLLTFSDFHSRCRWLLPSMGLDREFSDRHRIRPSLISGPIDSCREVDRISSDMGSWKWTYGCRSE